jgi:uncharacterized protein YndB with AHSA1/START domain
MAADEMHRELELPVTLAALWRAMTEPERLRTWLADEISWTLQPGGEAHFVVEGEPREGWVEEIRRPENGEATLVFWWQADGEPASRVSLALTETAAGSRLVVAESRPLEVLDAVGIPLGGAGGRSHGPAMVCA